MSNAPKFIEHKIQREDPLRKVGLGAVYPRSDAHRVGKFVGALKRQLACPVYNLPMIESVRLHYDGPLTSANVQGSFGAQINPLGSSSNSPPPGCNSVESTMAEPGKLQTFALVCAIGWQVEPEPVCFTAKGNAWTTPSTGAAKPVSPDAFTANDVATAGALGLVAGATMQPALMEWGWWQQEAFYHMVRAYNLRWQYGNHTNIVYDSLRYTAYMPSNSQDGSASSSELDTAFFVRSMNAYYQTQLGSPLSFLSIDRTRVGNQNLGGTPGVSVFRPTRAYDTVGATYGGSGLKALLRGNSEFRKLTVPFLLKPGVPIGLFAQVSNSDDQALMQSYLDASQSYAPAALGGTIPATFTDQANVNVGNSLAGTAGVTGVEPSLDSPSVANSLQVLAQRVIFKGGGFKITVALKGYEITDDQAEMLKDPDIKGAIQSECGCALGWQ